MRLSKASLASVTAFLLIALSPLSIDPALAQVDGKVIGSITDRDTERLGVHEDRQVPQRDRP